MPPDRDEAIDLPGHLEPAAPNPVQVRWSAPPALPPGYLSRPRLLALLGESSQADLVIVRAPAGGGKTALVTEWLGDRGTDDLVVWLTIDEQHPTRERVWGDVSAALRDASPDPLVPAGTPTGSGGRGRASYVSCAVMANQMGRGLWLVLDDFQFTAPAVERDVARFVALGQQIRVVVLTRRSSMLESALFAVRMRTSTVTGDQLAFTPEEIRALAAATCPSVGVVDPEVVQRATGGHPLLTRLVLASWTGPTLSMHSVDKMNVAEIVSLIPEELRDFALITAQSPVVDVPLAGMVADVDDAGDRLDQLLRAGLCAVDGDGMFSFPGYLRSALVRHSESVIDAVRRRRAKSVAASYLAERPRQVLAVFRLLVESGQHAQLWPHIIRNLFDLSRAEAAAIESVLGGLPVSEFANVGTLAALLAAVCSIRQVPLPADMAGLICAGSDELETRSAGSTVEDEFWHELARMVVLRHLCRYESAVRAADRVQASVARFDAAARSRLAPAIWTGLMLCADVYLVTCALDQAAQVLDAADCDQHPQRACQRRALRAYVDAMCGDVKSAAARLALPSPGCDRPDGAVPGPDVALGVARAAIQLEGGDPHAAQEYLRALWPRLRARDDWPYALVVMSRAHLALDPAAGIEDVDRLLRQSGRHPTSANLGALLASAVADLAIAAGDVQRAIGLVAERREHDIALRLSAARIGLITNDKGAVSDLRELLRREDLWPRLRAQALLLLAVHLYRGGHVESAGEMLRRARAVAAGEGIRLIMALVPRGELDAMAHAAGVELEPNVHRTDPMAETLQPVALTPRETLLLAELAAGVSLREIAATEFVALSTVKSQTRSIYRKLGASSRHDAVDIAFRRGLLR